MTFDTRTIILNKHFSLPFKDLWNKYYYDEKIVNSNEEICFIFEEYSPIPYKYGFIKYLKNRYKKAKFVFLYSNPIHQRSIIRLNYIKREFDLIMTPFKNDAVEYGLTHYISHYSAIPYDTEDANKCDVFFVGANKGRLNTIIRVYEELRENNLECDFNIIDVDQKHQIYDQEISYNKRLTYYEVLKKINSSKCILEVVQNEQNGPTLRVMEAIAYKKKLITNNKTIIEEPYYNNNFISIFDKELNIDIDFIRAEKSTVNCDYIDHMSPLKMLKSIEQYLYVNK